jgi:hypothetical protein
MSRSGYDDYDGSDNPEWAMIRWRGAVHSALCGKRGQAFLRELREALDALEAKRLIAGELEAGGDVCALGAVGRKRGIDMSEIDPEDRETVADTFDIAPAMAAEIMWLNDESDTPERRYQQMKAWVEAWTS